MKGAPSHATFPPAVILAGGLSSRMGRPKAGLVLGGRSMLTRVIERLRPQVAGIAINLNADPDPASAFGLEVVPDTIPGFVGPLAGILAAMRHTVRKSPGASHVLTVPVDTPLFPKSLAARLKTAITSGGEIAVAFSAGEMHPLFALWPVALADDLEAWIHADEKRRVRAFIARHESAAVEFPLIPTAAGPLDPFFNINTPEELRQAEAWLPYLEDREP
ncbi:molybdenum cofactor guanylyltransferase MobA [Sinorhizobium meliloti WSM1022]|jgi:molybdenum cofactor guanylyltransferase|uniref:molybdenum cofactor guanylyltransferase MobA n=1 Tax=Rhizobium meliloti TaxID=382 RepID=UPI0004131661|nr:molybdenum cofactor guanylyltransferase MobA [Sinorhizobium meliloti]ASQ03856.1 molybdenum cofactor guanylyltransferase [Sinorhizobium meliloti]MCO6423464.1 molybdenum cofactor guanylyltransferase MobA [Sinorhizobium meliloti]MDW9409339.1 molybdenum cofactor guanylyltransferase MobA [Sinorhizobium meliloti]MDW9442112.1 molybdenum cofactor guanylyltransferase MobA [Sinorhizobium meliloti]MDW9454495.1 molybdenum cofactor guanylyltransferase MobA [Sinorhizobium meliloti]